MTADGDLWSSSCCVDTRQTMCLVLLFLCFLCPRMKCDVVKPVVHLQPPNFLYETIGSRPSTENPFDDVGYNYQKPPDATNPPLFDPGDHHGYNYHPPPPQDDEFAYEYPKPAKPFDDDPGNFGYPVYLPPTSKKPSELYGVPEKLTTTRRPVPQQDFPLDPISPSATYLPPPLSDEYLPPADDDVVTIDVPDPSNTYLPPTATRTSKSNSLQIKITNMACMKSTTRSFFKTSMQTSRPLASIPVIESLQTPSASCKMSSTEGRNLFTLNMNGLNQMAQCGIHECKVTHSKANLCMNIRFPTVQGLKLPEDILLTLQCRPQEKLVSRVKYLTIFPQEILGRSVQAATAIGGKQIEFNGNGVLLRRSPTNPTTVGEFTVPVQPGSSIILGEELLLRVQVKNTDGWKYSRLAEVTMHRVNPNGNPSNEPQNTLEILDNDGCRNIRLNGVITADQEQDVHNPLISQLPLRAFAFQGMKSGDQMVLTYRILGCVEPDDCKVKCRRRSKRHRKQEDDADETRSVNSTEAYESEMQFKIVMPEDGKPKISYKYERKIVSSSLFIQWVPFIVLGVFCIFALAVYYTIQIFD